MCCLNQERLYVSVYHLSVSSALAESIKNYCDVLFFQCSSSKPVNMWVLNIHFLKRKCCQKGAEGTNDDVDDRFVTSFLVTSYNNVYLILKTILMCARCGAEPMEKSSSSDREALEEGRNLVQVNSFIKNSKSNSMGFFFLRNFLCDKLLSAKPNKSIFCLCCNH